MNDKEFFLEFLKNNLDFRELEVYHPEHFNFARISYCVNECTNCKLKKACNEKFENGLGYPAIKKTELDELKEEYPEYFI